MDTFHWKHLEEEENRINSPVTIIRFENAQTICVIVSTAIAIGICMDLIDGRQKRIHWNGIGGVASVITIRTWQRWNFNFWIWIIADYITMRTIIITINIRNVDIVATIWILNDIWFRFVFATGIRIRLTLGHPTESRCALIRWERWRCSGRCCWCCWRCGRDLQFIAVRQIGWIKMINRSMERNSNRLSLNWVIQFALHSFNSPILIDNRLHCLWIDKYTAFGNVSHIGDGPYETRCGHWGTRFGCMLATCTSIARRRCNWLRSDRLRLRFVSVMASEWQWEYCRIHIQFRGNALVPAAGWGYAPCLLAVSGFLFCVCASTFGWIHRIATSQSTWLWSIAAETMTFTGLTWSSIVPWFIRLSAIENEKRNQISAYTNTSVVTILPMIGLWAIDYFVPSDRRQHSVCIALVHPNSTSRTKIDPSNRVRRLWKCVVWLFRIPVRVLRNFLLSDRASNDPDSPAIPGDIHRNYVHRVSEYSFVMVVHRWTCRSIGSWNESTESNTHKNTIRFCHISAERRLEWNLRRVFESFSLHQRWHIAMHHRHCVPCQTMRPLDGSTSDCTMTLWEIWFDHD